MSILNIKHELVSCIAVHEFSIELNGTTLSGTCDVTYDQGIPLDFAVSVDQIRDLESEELMAIELYISNALKSYYESPETTSKPQSVLPLLN